MPAVSRNIDNEVRNQTGTIDYNAEPTARRFHNSKKLYRLLKGPVGSGKTAALVMELLMRSMQQEPFNGIRKTRWCVTRATYPELKSTTIRTWQYWLPHNVCPIVYDIPIRGNFRQRMGDGTICDMEVLFMALETEDDIKKLLSLELTGIACNEMRELPFEVFNHMRGRIPRYPSVKEGGATWHGIIGDTNPPKLGHWIHQIESGAIEMDDFEIFDYPPGVYFDNETQSWEPNPDAENLINLPVNYYKNQIQGNSENYIRVMLAGEYGIPLYGKAIYPRFSQRLHVAKEQIRPDRGLPLIIGFDFGLHPAAIIAQLSRRGKLCILDELAPEDVDLDSFIPDYVLPLVQEKYSGFAIQVTGDPSGIGRSGLDKRTAFDVCASFGFRLAPTFSNSFQPRKNAVDYFLNRTEAFSVSPHCNYVIEGMAGGYVYEKMKSTMAGSVRHKEKAEKNEYSHGQDAIQYIALHILKGSATKQTKKMLNGLGNDKQETKKFLWA